jgi:hypothetical protein
MTFLTLGKPYIAEIFIACSYIIKSESIGSNVVNFSYNILTITNKILLNILIKHFFYIYSVY